jgi:signal transduction histidine kinase|tara:strand:+ start:1848 stop:2930 length:1083 start_codon:yes stop_codon:yes gene_type:complete
LKILVVDDDLGDRKLIRRQLGASAPGWTLAEVDGCASALAFTDFAPDAVLLDYLLPRVSGLDAISGLRDRWPGAALIMMTGAGDEDVAKSAIQQGAADYLIKAKLTPEGLITTIEASVKLARMQRKIAMQQRELATFAHVLVHDFKAPIRGIDFLCDLIAKALDAGDSAEAIRELDEMRGVGRQMSDLVQSLSEYIGADGEDRHDVYSLNDIAARAQSALRSEIADVGARIEIVQPDWPVFGSAPLLAQLLQNLLSNAIRYRASDPTHIRISASDAAAGLTRISVEDNGRGVPLAFRDRIFEPFQRFTSRDCVAGSGLGLATCRKIVERHGGRIWCGTSALGGAGIHFTLPAQAHDLAAQ